MLSSNADAETREVGLSGSVQNRQLAAVRTSIASELQLGDLAVFNLAVAVSEVFVGHIRTVNIGSMSAAHWIDHEMQENIELMLVPENTGNVHHLPSARRPKIESVSHIIDALIEELKVITDGTTLGAWEAHHSMIMHIAQGLYTFMSNEKGRV